MTFSEEDRMYMARALQLAANGRGHVSPNPMVGAVIVHGGRIIGEGWHRRFGGPHAEVNAVRSVSEADKALISSSTIYVTLEPCSHYGKTPPCAKLLVDIGIGRVVVASLDPNPKVSGRGIEMLRAAGIEVRTGLMETEAKALNKAFMTAHKLRRPFITLKWACSKDGFMDSDREAPAKFSNTLSSQIVHWRRANHDAIAVGANTVVRDNPQLTVRSYDGRNPRPVVFGRRWQSGCDDKAVLLRDDTILISDDAATDLHAVMHRLYSEFGITSLLVEGGASLLKSFISNGLWDEAYIETAFFELGAHGTVKAPFLDENPTSAETVDGNLVCAYYKIH